MANSVAASGVPNSAVKNAAMPHSVAVRQLCSLRRSSLPVCQPMSPPICSAAPSRPALPPVRCVSTVPMKMAGSSSRATGLPSCTASMTSSVFMPSVPVSLYSATMARPASGSR